MQVSGPGRLRVPLREEVRHISPILIEEITSIEYMREVKAMVMNLEGDKKGMGMIMIMAMVMRKKIDIPQGWLEKK